MSRRRRRVLLLDDDARFRDGLSALLADDQRIDVVAAVGDPDAAVAAALADRPDVAVVDVRLLQGDGAAATRRLRAACPGLRVFGLSLFSDASARADMLAAGAERYFVKGGAEPEVLQALVEGLEDHPHVAGTA